MTQPLQTQVPGAHPIDSPLQTRISHLQRALADLRDVVDDRLKEKNFECNVTITLNFDLAYILANLILASHDPNKALLALAHQIKGS